MNQKLHLRPVTANDRPFLFKVFCSTRPDILAATHLPENQRQSLLTIQFNAQDNDYKTRFPNADYGIIQFGNTLIGRLYVNRTNEEVHLIEITILPEHRGEGLGATLMKALIEEARLTERRVRLHVEKTNPVLKFYQQLGFVKIGEKPMHFEMAWTADAKPKIIVDESM